ncbi:MAG: chromosomal replication initiator protein DnaA [Bacteriovoracaceae bacterium]
MSDNFPINHFFSPDKTCKNNNLPTSERGGSLVKKDPDLVKSMLNQDYFSDNLLTQKPSEAQSHDLEQTHDLEQEELKSITAEVLNILEHNIKPDKYKMYFESSFTVSSINHKVIKFSVTTNFVKKMIENFYIVTLQNAVADLMGSQFDILIDVMNSNKRATAADSLSTDTESAARESNFQMAESTPKPTSFKIGSFTSTKDELIDEVNSEERKTLQNNFGNKIDDKKTFNNFIVGPSNNMAHAFSIAVAKEPGKLYPQLYIHGNSGLGKTHLLHAICNHVKLNNPHFRICLTTATDFMSEMVMAIQSNKTGVDRFAEFRRKYTDLVDVLIIDDIHELQGKARTQSEFFYVFNELQAKKKQLIFTSDKPPKEIVGLEDRIRTRLNSALLVDIQQPDLETRIAILKKKAFEKDIYLDDEVINLIASSVKSNVRELEGKLVKLGAYSDLMNVDIDLEIAKQQLNLSHSHDQKVINIDAIGNAVATYMSIPLGDIKGKTRKKEVALARHIAMYMSHKILKVTLEEIGEYFDNRDHSTVIHGVKKIEELSKKDSRVSQQIYEIESTL